MLMSKAMLKNAENFESFNIENYSTYYFNHKIITLINKQIFYLFLF